MAIPITVPRLGWNMEQGVFVGWLKADGATIRAGESLFTLESEKATEDIEAFDEGVLHIPANGPSNGDVVLVGIIIGFVLQPGEPIPIAPLTPVVGKEGLGVRGSESRTKNTTFKQGASPPSPQSSPPVTGEREQDHPASSPRARRTAANLGLDWKAATGTGRTGRIRERDVLAMAAPVSSTRRIIAERMLTSLRSTAPVTLTTTIDATNLVKLRKEWKDGLVPSYTDFFVKSAALALEKHPVLNSRWQNDRIVPCDGIHIGIAVDTDAGLLAPVVRDVLRLSLKELSTRTHDLVERARQRKLSLNELQGGTFTVTSLGAFGIDAFTPIINFPECAILGIGRIRRCPVVLDEQIVIRDQVTLSLTFDHRITDGAPAARFLQTLSGLVENPNFV